MARAGGPTQAMIPSYLPAEEDGDAGAVGGGIGFEGKRERLGHIAIGIRLRKMSTERKLKKKKKIYQCNHAWTHTHTYIYS